MSMSMSMVVQRFLLVTYPAQGHINPALELAKRLIGMGADVTIVLTLHMYRRIINKITIPGLSFLPFSDGYDAGGFDPSQTDFDVYQSELKSRCSHFVSNLIANDPLPYTCLVYTLLLPWLADVALPFNLPTALLWIEPATVLVILYHYFHGHADYINHQTSLLPPSSSSVSLPGLPFPLSPRDIPSFLLLWKPTMFSYALPFFQNQILQLDRETTPTVLVNTFHDLEVEPLRAVHKINMIPIGPLIPSAFLDGHDTTDNSSGGDIFPVSGDCLGWLDSKQPKSVVYLSFGSYLELSTEQTDQIVRALLDCGRPFLWVIRDKTKSEELCCREELEKRGKIVTWCSQVQVLSHPSVGCFVTHCGWNSTIESLVAGVPMVAFPQWTDQMTNAKLVEDVWEIGMRVDHHVSEDGIVQGEDIKTCLDTVMDSTGDKANELRINAKKWKSLATEAAKEGGSSEKNLRAFLHDIGQQFLHNHA